MIHVMNAILTLVTLPSVEVPEVVNLYLYKPTILSPSI